VTKSAPGHNFWHDDRRIATAGGIAADSAQGSKDAAAHGRKWIDCDGQLMHRTHAGIKLGRKDRDVVWVNAHGAPFLPAYIKGKFEDHAYSSIDAAKHGLRTARETFDDNHQLGLNTEWEVKDLRPFTTKAALDRAMELLAADARTAYGKHWQDHVQVKVLNTLHGGQKYALKVCKAAHKAGFTTMLLNHHHKPVKIGPVRARYVDYVRGPWKKRGVK
jgi:hypothetical protein